MLKDFGYSDISQSIQAILGSGMNKSSIKVYVPQGAQLLGTQGIENTDIKVRNDDEIQKQYFMFEMDIPAGGEQTVTLSYRLPQKLNTSIADTYRFFAQRQPGIVVSTLEKHLLVAQGLKVYESYPSNITFPEKNDAFRQTTLENDDYMSVLVGAE